MPQDVDVNLRADEPPDQCYAPKKLVHTWYVTSNTTLVVPVTIVHVGGALYITVDPI